MNFRFNPTRLFRFSISSLLLAMVCVSSYLSSYRYGEQVGAKNRYNESCFLKVYNLADLMLEEDANPDDDQAYDEIIAMLRTDVAPDSWKSIGQNGEQCDVQPFKAQMSLVVSQYGAVHDKIEVALNNRRDERLKKYVDHVAAELETLGAARRTGVVVLTKSPVDEPLAMSALELKYEHAIRNLTGRWGKPGFDGNCDEARFPQWSLAQKIAVWPQRGGDVYLSIEDRSDGRTLLAGCRMRD